MNEGAPKANVEVKPEGDTDQKPEAAAEPKKLKGATPVVKKPITGVQPKGKFNTKKDAPKEPQKSKAPKKEKEAVKQIKGAQLLKTGPGPAMVQFAKKLRKTPEQGMCHVLGCEKKSVTLRAKWCMGHKKAIRKAQLKANNKVWRKRVKEGLAGHHVIYAGAATAFSLKNRELAEKIVAAGRATIATKKELEKAIQAVPAQARKEARAK